MRKITFLFILGAIVISVSPVCGEEDIEVVVDEEAASLPQSFLGEITAERVNLRAGVSTNFEILIKLDSGDKLLILDKQYDWYQVKLPPQAEVYVAKAYIQRTGTGDYATVDSLNIRAGAGLNYSVLGQISEGDQVRVVGEKDDWYAIVPPDSTTGWVHSDYVKLSDPDIKKYDAIEETGLKQRLATVTVSETATGTAVAATLTEEKPEPVTEPPAAEKLITKEEAQEEGKEIPPLAVGEILPLGRFFNRIGTHKIVENGIVTYYLQSSRYNLNLYREHPVRIWGEVVSTGSDNIPLIEVTKIELIWESPSG